MQSLLDKLGANATTLIYAAIVLAAVILVVVVLRMLIGRRVHPAGAARTRQACHNAPRLPVTAPQRSCVRRIPTATAH